MIGKLYTFRRCPYAMRARMALKIANLPYEKIEVDLKNKPKDLFEYSPKGTVPVLVLNSNEIIDESLEVLDWVFENYLDQTKDEKGERLLSELTDVFIPALNRYKYASRYDDVDLEKEAEVMLNYLNKLESLLQSNTLLSNEPTKYNIAIFPFIRQANIANPEWLPRLNNLYGWFNTWKDSVVFKEIMEK